MVSLKLLLAIILLFPSLVAAQGKYNASVVFDSKITGSTGVTIPNSSSLQLTTGMTLMAWVYPYAVHNDWRAVISKGGSAFDYWLYSSNTGTTGWCSGTGPVGAIGLTTSNSVCS